MKSATSAANSNLVNDPRRCQHRTASGRRCRLAVIDFSSGLCFHHAEKVSEALHASNLRSILAGDTTQFEESEQVNKFLSNLLLLLAEDRISTRRAAVMAYTCNLLLRTLTVNIQEHRAFGDDEPTRLNIDLGDLPRPDRSSSPSAESHPAAEPLAPHAPNVCIVNSNSL